MSTQVYGMYKGKPEEYVLYICKHIGAGVMLKRIWNERLVETIDPNPKYEVPDIIFIDGQGVLNI